MEMLFHYLLFSNLNINKNNRNNLLVINLNSFPYHILIIHLNKISLCLGRNTETSYFKHISLLISRLRFALQHKIMKYHIFPAIILLLDFLLQIFRLIYNISIVAILILKLVFKSAIAFPYISHYVFYFYSYYDFSFI